MVLWSWLMLTVPVVAHVQERRPRVSTRRRALRGLGLPMSFVALPAVGAKPYNPLNLKGQYWETGNMVYTKPSLTPETAERDARSDLSATLETLRAARRDAENGDADAVLAKLRDGDVSERTIRVAANKLINASDRETFLAREKLDAALRAYSKVQAAAEVRRTPNHSPHPLSHSGPSYSRSASCPWRRRRPVP